MRSRRIIKVLVNVRSITIAEFPCIAGVLPILVALDPETGGPAIWFESLPGVEVSRRSFLIYRDDDEVIGDGGYPYDIHLGSIVDRSFVWHVYERRGS